MSVKKSQTIEHARVEHREGRLLVDDLIRYLSRLAVLNKEGRTGNPELSDGLGQIAKALRPYADRSIAELADLVRSIPDRPRISSGREKASLPSNLESLSQVEIKKILDDDRFTKSQLIEMGERRFGIPRSRLMRLCKEDTVESIRAALDHERTLDFISAEAQRVGQDRLS